MSARDRRSFRPTGLFEDFATKDRHQREDISLVKEHDRSTKWFNIGDAGAPAFNNSWGNYGSGWCPARFMRDAAGIVYTQGLITNATYASGQLLFTLPEGFRPIDDLMFGVTAYYWNGASSDYRPIEGQLNPTGNIFVNWPGGGGITWCTLTAIIFPAEQ